MDKIDLKGIWNLTRTSDGESLETYIPGDIMHSLLENHVIPDPYRDRNELKVQWVGKEDWEFTRVFEVSADFIRNRNILLCINLLDTFADIYINEKYIGSGNNAFKKYVFPVKNINQGRNSIRIIIHSPEAAALKAAAELPYQIPFMSYPEQSPNRNLIRKPQCHGGWDWGPALMTGGIYGDINLESVSRVRIDYLHTDILHRNHIWNVEISVELTAFRKGVEKIIFSLAGITEEIATDLNPGVNRITHTIPITDPDLWWPAGYGNQPLYPLTVKTSEESIIKKIGFRDLEVITEKDTYGRSLVFRINGRDIFCKGTNWIPMDGLPARQTPERYEKFLKDVTDANMNMIRVWGGGQYEKDIFYDICDEKGILVWQDFMFSCALYPASEPFLDNVKKEAAHQIKRLKNHPSLVLWCGNNEDIGALTWFEESRENRDRYIIDYDRLNEGIIGKTVKELDSGRRWWPSSPSAGEGDYSDNWHDDTKGDMHYWSVWHEGASFEAYYTVTPRFCSEFGYQSFPGIDTIRMFADKDQQNVSSPAMLHHQKNERGNSIILSSLSRYFRFPSTFEDFLYLSQVQQTFAVRTAVEYWRSRRPVCMGILYWQLNDLWPAVSWSSIEYSGKWKLLHYAVQDFFAPVHIAGFIKKAGHAEIYGINDTFNEISGTLTVLVLNFDGSIIKEYRSSETLKAEEARELFLYDVPDDNEFTENHFLYFKFTYGFETRENYLFLTTPNRCNLKHVQFSMEIEPVQDRFDITLKTDKPAFFVKPECAVSGIFNNEGFFLVPRTMKKISFLPETGCTADSLRDLISFKDLRRTYS